MCGADVGCPTVASWISVEAFQNRTRKIGRLLRAGEPNDEFKSHAVIPEHLIPNCMCTARTLTNTRSCIVVINVLFVKVFLQMLLVERCMREVYLFTHVDGLCQYVGCCQGSQPLSSAAALPCCVTPTMQVFVPRGAGSGGHKGILKE